MELLFFQVGQNNCALPLECVQGVELAALLSDLPEAPEIVAGCLNYRGSILPVIRVSERFGMAEEEMQLEDRLIVVKTKRTEMILWVNSVSEGVKDVHVKDLDLPSNIGRMPGLRGVSEIDGEVILIHDMEAFLSEDEEQAISASLNAMESPAQ